MNTTKTIFFSYSRKDSDFALKLGKQLREAGAIIWLDQLDINPGTNWDDSIQKALEDSDTLLVILSKTSVISRNVNDEYSYAIEEGKRVVPVLMENCNVPFRLRRLQYADFSQDYSQGINTLIETLNLNKEVAGKLSNAYFTKSKKLKSLIPKNSNKTSFLTKNKFWALSFVIIVIVIFLDKLNVFSSQLNSSNSLTVLVFDESGKDKLVLPNRGQVKLIYGDANVVETINSKGEATFKQIPDNFFKSNSKVEIIFNDPEGEPYRSVYKDSLYQLAKGEYVSLPVKLFGLEKVNGITKDFITGEPIDSVRVVIAGIPVFSNAYGEFSLNIPKEKQQKFLTIRAFKSGYELYEINDVPIQTNQELPIVLKPKKTQ